MGWQGRLRMAVTVVTLIVLTFTLGVPATFRWIVGKFWRVMVGVLSAVVLMSVPPLDGSPGVAGARFALVVGVGGLFGLLFVAVFFKLARSAWSNAWNMWKFTRMFEAEADGLPGEQ